VLAPFVAHFWNVEWDLSEKRLTETLPHPTVHLVFEQSATRGRIAEVAGVHTARFARELAGRGTVFGIKFRPATFYCLYGQAVSYLTDRVVPVGDVLGREGEALAAALFAGTTLEERIAVAEEFLLPRLATMPPTISALRDLVERIATSQHFTRAEQVALALGSDTRNLQRKFRRYVGVSPKWVIQRFRLHEAAERLKLPSAPNLASLATELGYADQAHFTRDFTKMIGRSPAAFRQNEAQ
jgi:AraC-like DNA-binding protein